MSDLINDIYILVLAPLAMSGVKSGRKIRGFTNRKCSLSWKNQVSSQDVSAHRELGKSCGWGVLGAGGYGALLKLTVFVWTSQLWSCFSSIPFLFVLCACKDYIPMSVTRDKSLSRFCHLKNSERKWDTVACISLILDTDHWRLPAQASPQASDVSAKQTWH